jgi:Domain of unknown function (DUF6791)/ThiF family
MSTGLISRSPDLARLREEGYEVAVRDDHLVIESIPYVNEEREVEYGTLVSTLALAGDVTAKPDTHTAFFVGDAPCDREGNRLHRIIIGGQHQLSGSLTADHQFSSKPSQGYPDYYEKMTSYIRILSGPAQAIVPDATPRTFRPVAEADGDSVFEYADTASSRAGIRAATEKLEIGRVAIVGIGGTGSYTLDLLAKTPAGELHLYDGDHILTHNAFRAPGAASLEELRTLPNKAQHYQELYSRMRRGIVAHPYYVDGSTVDQLRDMDFVFLCLDDGPARKLIVDELHEWGKPFIDVGIGVEERDASLGGLVRTTASTRTKNDHVSARVPFSSNDVDDDYRRNIQVADLNALNAALAVIKYKKLAGFYNDLDREHNSVYVITGNLLINDERA